MFPIRPMQWALWILPLVSWQHAHAQPPQRLPPIDQEEFWLPAVPASPAGAARAPNRPWAQPAAYPGGATDPLPPPNETLAGQPDISSQLTSHKQSFFQLLSFTDTSLDRGSYSSLGVEEIELYGIFALPCPTTESPLLITPGFEARLLNGPYSPDLPGAVYDAYLQFRWMSKIGERWGVDVAVSPGIHSDFEVYDSEAIRITGHAIAAYEWSPTTKLVLGATYLDREDVMMLPIAGMIWNPSDDLRYELVFPKPKIARRVRYSPCEWEDWIYVSGELGGGSWLIQRVNGGSDVMSLRDYRVMFGVERKGNGGAGMKLEIGYAFSRELEYLSSPTIYEFDASVFIRLGVKY